MQMKRIITMLEVYFVKQEDLEKVLFYALLFAMAFGAGLQLTSL